MARIIVTTDPSERHDASVVLDERAYPVHLTSDHAAAQLIEQLGRRETMVEAGMSGAPLLTQRQIRRMEKLPRGHKLVRVRDGVPVVRQPDGQLSRMQPSGRLVAAIPIERVQSYLHVHG